MRFAIFVSIQGVSQFDLELGFGCWALGVGRWAFVFPTPYSLLPIPH
ncbi:hypothetical protein [Nodularia spumigena]|nr:hypothetical protein [Nodularia spumigena]